jgi:hypothetical protein
VSISGIDSIGLGQFSIVCYCEHGNEPSGFIRKMIFLTIKTTSIFNEKSCILELVSRVL